MSVSRKVAFWSGSGFFIETFADGDGAFRLVIHTPDFDTLEQAQKAETYFQNLVMKRTNG